MLPASSGWHPRTEVLCLPSMSGTASQSPVGHEAIVAAKAGSGARSAGRSGQGKGPRAGRFPVVGLGGSAGSISALQAFFSRLPAEAGMAYVVVVHLSPEHESMLAAILQQHTSIPVVQVSGPVKLQPGHAYVIPPNKHLAMAGGILKAVEMSRPRGRLVTVDLFFRALAEAHGPAATAIVLSGGGGDGSVGLKRVKELGGLTIAQNPEEAEQGRMPRHAIATGMVDWILPVDQIPARLAQYQEAGRKLKLPPEKPSRRAGADATDAERDEAALQEILSFLKARTAHDFAAYKRATTLRRIARRMQVNGTGDLESYLAFLRTHPGETSALLQDLLISVTNFFRDTHAFEAFEGMLPQLFKGKSSTENIRVWVPACATGEEAYTVAMLLCEHAAEIEAPPQIQIFATDIDKPGIQFAREGRYPEAIAADVSENRLQRFFIKESGSYRIRRDVREVILFAEHDLLGDAPFSRLDLICCRNLLIYLTREAQAQVFDICHFALHSGGRLFLGSSESAEVAAGFFDPVDKKHRIYVRRNVRRGGLSLPTGSAILSIAQRSKQRRGIPILPEVAPPVPGLPSAPAVETFPAARGIWAQLHLRLMERIAPPSLLVNRDHEIVHLSQSAGRYLQFAGGEPSRDLLRIVRPELRNELRAALFRAAKSATPARVKGIPLELDGVPRMVEVSVECAADLAPDFLLVMFRESDPGEAPMAASPPDPAGEAASASVVRDLEDELEEMRDSLRESVEQYEASAEELQASNVELQAVNVELRLSTEELETGREEIITINQELKSKVEDLSRANTDLQNLMATTDIATVFLDRNLQIQRCTPSSTELFNFTLADIGRPLSDFTHRLAYPDFTRVVERVLERLATEERVVRDADGRWFMVRILPSHKPDDEIAGVVITCIDITRLREAEESRRWLSAIVESSNDAIFSLTLDGTIISWNGGAERVFGYREDEIKGRPITLIAPPEAHELQQSVLAKLKRGEDVARIEMPGMCKQGKRIDIAVSFSVMTGAAGEPVGVTAIAQDVTARNQSVKDLKQAKDELETQVALRTAQLTKRAGQLARMASELTFTEQRERKRIAAVLHDELQQILVAAKMRVEALDSGEPAKLASDVGKLTWLIDEALVNARSVIVELSPPILAEGLGSALEWLATTWMREFHNLTVECDIDTSIDARQEDMRVLIFLAVRELLFNVVKHSSVRNAFVELVVHDDENLRVTVRDHGLGFDPQEAGPDGKAGSGFGLISLHERLELLGGSLKIRSAPNDGVEAIIMAPRHIAATTPGKIPPPPAS